ncbi:MAG: radical SAM protein [Deltaproteobacteria bacterium]|nr:radical SAM protein [Deltaproteobacteria bacterium]
MRVLLISANTETINMPVLPLGLACVAEATQAAGHDVKVVDLLGQEDTLASLKAAIQQSQPEIIGISVRNIDDQSMGSGVFLLDPVKEVVHACRSLSGAPIVLGGAGYSIFPQSALAYLEADMGIQGEGEKAFVTLLERLRQGADLSGIPGLYLPEKGIQGKVAHTKDLDTLSLPLPGMDHWTVPKDKDLEIWLPFQTRRGCPMDCSYCSTATIEGRIMRKHSPARVIEAISQYVAVGMDRLFFVDNTFNLPRSYAKTLCKALVQANLGISWRCILYPNNADDELIELMAKAGCVEVSLGSESGSAEILRRLNKKFTPEDVRRISDSLKRHGISRMGFLLLGGPGETRKTVEESLAFADSLALEALKITMGIRIYPGTSLARTAVKEGMVSPDDNLLFPRYYMVKEIEDWLRETVNRLMAERPNWVN